VANDLNAGRCLSAYLIGEAELTVQFSRRLRHLCNSGGGKNQDNRLEVLRD
jgi:hypothetical protein